MLAGRIRDPQPSAQVPTVLLGWADNNLHGNNAKQEDDMAAAALPAEAGLNFEEAPLNMKVRRDDTFSLWADKQYQDKYSWKDEEENPTEVWDETGYRVVFHELGALGYTPEDPEFRAIVWLINKRILMPGGRKLAQAGRPFHQTNNCFLYRCGDSREAWFEELAPKCGMALSSGGGIGIVYSDVRPYGSKIKRTGGIATGPLTPANMVNDMARRIIGGGNRRAAIWAGLHWNHPDIFAWIVEKDWPDYVKAMKKKAAEEGKDQDVMAPLDMTNISVILDTDFFDAYGDESHPDHELAHRVYWAATEHMVAHGEPGFSIDCGDNHYENLRNACTEISSEDDSDVCNLASINLARVDNIEDFKEVVRLATLLLLAGTVYSDVPHDEVLATREKNRRLGLGPHGPA